MAVDIKKILTSLKERKETMLVWGLGAVALCLGIFLLLGYTREASSPPSLEVVVKRKKPLKSKEEIKEEATAKLKEAQKISPFVDYQDILTKNLFIQSRMAQIGDEKIVGAGGFVLKGIIRIADAVKAFIDDLEGKPHLVGVGQRIGTSEVKVVAIDFENQSVTLMSKGWEKPQVIRLVEEKIGQTGDIITFKPSEKQKEAEKPKKATEEEAKKAITEAKKALSEASDAILTARSEGADTDEAEARRDDAKVKLEDAQEAMKEKDYKRAKESAKSAQALAQEAKKLSGEAEEEEEEEEIIGTKGEGEGKETEEGEEETGEEPGGAGEGPAL
jgi:cytochrome c-type biogenesis protein CcmH/NrfF